MVQKHKAIILSGSQKPQALFLDFMLFFNIAVQRFGKKNKLVKFELPKRFIEAQNIPISGPNYVN